MRSSFMRWLPVMLLSAFILQSCVKSLPLSSNSFKDDKLLLSQVTGQNTGTNWNLYEFVIDPSHKFWTYQANYSYGSERFGFENFRTLRQVGFVNSGAFNFTYTNSLPDEIIDNSNPGVDQGYWKLYYNDKGQVIKNGFAFSTAAGPTEFEWYGYDDHSNITSLVYGRAVDTPLYKLTYNYDGNDNLVQMQVLFPNGYSNADASTGRRIFSTLTNSTETEAVLSKPMFKMLRNFSEKGYSLNPTTRDLSFSIPPTKLVGDSNVIYQLYMTATITNDGKINPYRELGRLLFFISSRNASPDVDPYFWQLQNSNPTSVQYILNPDFGVYAPMISSQSYSYNDKGYPLTMHEAGSDPDGIWDGITYTQDRIFTYIPNK